MKGYPAFSQLSEELRRVYYAYWLANYTTAKTRDFSFNLVKKIKQRKSISELRKEIDRKMAEDNVLDYVKTNLASNAYGYVSWVKPLLVLIEKEQSDDSVFIKYSRNLHVDHILPEEWEKNTFWKKNWKRENAEQWIDKIGNLTLLSGQKNIKASNLEFAKKKRIYKGTGIDGTTSFEIKKILRNSKWTLTEVRLRQKWLVNQTKKILDLDL